MGRKRIKDLPPNLYENNGYYQYKHPISGKHFGLGKEKETAIEEAQQINYALKPLSERVQKILLNTNKKTQLFEEFIEYFKNEILPTRKLSNSMLKDYHRKLPHIIEELGKKSFEKLSIQDIAQFLKKFPPNQSNNYRSALKVIFQYAIAEGLIEKNLADATIKKTTEIKRQRLTLDGFYKIKEQAPDWLKNAMDLALITGQRRSDIVALRWEDIHDGFVWIQQQKVEKWGTGYLKIPVTKNLKALLIKCKNSGKFVISRNDKPINADYLTKAFETVRNKSGYFLEMENPPTFHEIRALSSHLQEKAGVATHETQVLLGHASEEMTKHYQERHEIIWKEVNEEILEKFWKTLEDNNEK